MLGRTSPVLRSSTPDTEGGVGGVTGDSEPREPVQSSNRQGVSEWLRQYIRLAWGRRGIFAFVSKRVGIVLAFALVGWLLLSGILSSVLGGVGTHDDNRLLLLLGDIAAATLVSLICTPLTQIVDVAVSMGASGNTTVSNAMMTCVGEWLSKPLYMVQ